MAKQKLMHLKVRSSTLLEAIIAMVTIVAIFGIAMMIFINVTQATPSFKTTQAYEILNDYLLSGKINQKNKSIFILGDFRIEETETSYPSSGDLLKVHLIAFDKNQIKVAELTRIIKR